MLNKDIELSIKMKIIESIDVLIQKMSFDLIYILRQSSNSDYLISERKKALKRYDVYQSLRNDLIDSSCLIS